MTYYKAAQIIMNTWKGMLPWDDDKQHKEISGDDAFSIAMKMAYDALIEKSKINSNMAPETRKPSSGFCQFCYTEQKERDER